MTQVAINLLSPRRRQAVKQRGRATLWIMGVSLYAMATIGACVVLAAGEPTVDRIQERELSIARRELDQAKARLADIRQDRDAESLKVDAAGFVSEHADWSILFDLLADRRGQDVVLENVEVSPFVPEAAPGKPAEKAESAVVRVRAYVVLVEGFARSPQAAAEFADALQKAEVFRNVTLTDSRSKTVDGVSVLGFSIQCSLGNPEPAKGETR